MAPSTTRVKVLKVDFGRGEKRLLKEEIAVEEPLFIYVNDQHFVTLLANPSMKKELALGHLIAEGLIESLEEVRKVRVKGLRVNIILTKTWNSTLKASKIAVPIYTASGSTKPNFLEVLKGFQKPLVALKTKFVAAKILDMVRRLNEESKIHKKTQGTHSAAIFTFDGKLISFAEDVGRHNAVDKVIGDASLKKTDFASCLLLSSGRQPAYMVLKAARAGIPVVVSIAYPLESGVRAAEKTGLTLVHASGNRITVYTETDRLML